MKMLRLFSLLIMLLAAAEGMAKDFNVSVLYWSMKIEGQVIMRKGFEEVINAYNASNKGKNKIILTRYIAGEGREGLLKQISQIETAVQSRPDAIVIQPSDVSTLTKHAQEANSLNIPLFVYDQYVLNAKMTSYVTSDNYQAGWDNGIYIDSLFPAGQEIRIVVVEYFRVSATVERVDGFFDALRSKGRKFQVVGRYEAVEPESGKIAGKQILKDFPKKNSFDVLFTNNDGGGLSVVKELWNKGRKEIRQATIDGDPASVENIKNKRITVIDSAQFCAELGREIARKVIAYLNKEPFTQRHYIPTYPITEKTLKDYPGWMGRPTAPPREKSLMDEIKKVPASKLSAKEQSVVKVGLTAICPYLCEQGPGVWGGYIHDILSEVAKVNNFKLEIKSLPQEQLLSALKNREVNYIVAPLSMVRFLPDLRITGPRLGMISTGALFTPGVKVRLIDKESLSDKRIVFAHVGYESELDLQPTEFQKSMKITGRDVADRMMKMIGDRRVDLALGDYNVLRYTLLRRQLMTLEVQPTSLSGYNALMLVAHPKEPDFGHLPSHVDNWFETNRQGGKLEKVLKKYNLKDWDIFSH
ncbi:substrate-binding domain-containing protein [Bdellovibrio bacteriovorus]